MSNHDHSYHTGGAQNFMNKIAYLDSAMRKSTGSPQEILSLLSIQKDASILDAGAGSGYLTIPAARQTTGTIFALDTDSRMLEVIDTKAQAEKITSIQLLQGDIQNIPLPDGSVDIVLASLILHEVSSLSGALTQMSRVLKANGQLLCLEYEKTQGSAEGPPMHMRIPSADMKQAMTAIRFQIVQTSFSVESLYAIVAKKQEQEPY